MPLAMTAHVVYTALDPHSPATTSRIVMDEIVRGHLAYDGLVDDRRPVHEGAFGHVPGKDRGSLRGRLRHGAPLQRRHG